MLLLNVILAFIWVALTGEGGWNLLVGFILAYLVVGLTEQTLNVNTYRPRGGNYFRKLPQTVLFGLFFLRELMLASVQVFISILSPFSRLKPGVIEIPLDLTSDVQITLLGNLITLTPGTLTLDVSSDRRFIYVHSMRVDDPEAFRRSIKDGFEKRILEVFD